ncbi:hypothetical protein MLD38_037488 [Melastoma candidum]|uniref:Uncharacterized protein n=1 Tax=Melastoma candidum TaxID=119954 RepID=A0ACB9LN66_9MYRT|nr:hypothetical protein MLD38_037488 [Melastoma candidum]
MDAESSLKENPNCVLVVTPQGGHLGWVAGAKTPLGAPWTDPLVVDFLEHLRNGQQPEDPDPSFNIDESKHNPSENLGSPLRCKYQPFLIHLSACIHT